MTATESAPAPIATDAPSGASAAGTASVPGERAGRHRVVIVGGGFGGLYAAKALGDEPDVAVTLIDRRNHHLFQPLLYQVATGALAPGEIAQPLRSILRREREHAGPARRGGGPGPDERRVVAG